ncbi:ABC-three component system middle component 6 [Bacillus haynesii]|uniref:ABC-three component system middle component 6 n=2 Tax=Bacillaceae TaxID=186817 RepID=UPI002DDDA1D8|nr:ABC-three component system middle component 6 [Bacillus haynesii]
MSMILPDKYVVLTESFLGLSALILDTLNNKKMTIDKLWNAFEKKYINSKKIKNPPTYQKYIYVIEFMYLTNMISYNKRGEILNENTKIKDNESQR